MVATPADRHKDAGLSPKGNGQEQQRDFQIAHGMASYRMGRDGRVAHSRPAGSVESRNHL
jgi:hypothetical protein